MKGDFSTMFTLYYADAVGCASNCLYPHRAEINSEADLARAVAHDYVCAAYRGGRRSGESFLSSDCLAFDVDNDHSENPEDWITPETLRTLLPGVGFAVHFSRNHEKEKNGRAARPRFHVFFPIAPVSDAVAYRDLKLALWQRFPFFDRAALDAARFFFGTEGPLTAVFPGPSSITDFLGGEADFDAGLPQGSFGGRAAIEEGQRNATLSRIAARLVKRFGLTEEAFRLFTEEAGRCRPPLDDAELGRIWASACRFGKKLQDQPGYIPPDKYRPGTPLKPADYSDIGQARVLAMDCGSELAYSTGTDWLVYDGRRWVASRPKAVGCAERFLDRQLADALAAVSRAKQALLQLGIPEKALAAGGKTLEKQLPPGQGQALRAYLDACSYLAFVMKRRDFKYIQSAMLAVRPMVEVETKDVDSRGFLLNCPDGTYDLRVGIESRRDHDASDCITMMTAYAPGDEGKALWLDALDKIFQGDRELIGYVQMTVGLCAIGEVFQEALTISYGAGSNGKSTFWNTVAGALGDYSGMISADTLTVGCRRNVKPEIAEIKGKRILIAAELEEGMRLSTSIVKQLSSTDEIQGERKYCDPFKFRPTHSLILFTNHLPRVGAMDTGIWRRLIVIPFSARITGSGEIKNYTRHLLDYAGPYIVKWIIEGAVKAYEAGFVLTPPRVVREAVEKYRADNDWMQHFLDECCEIGGSLSAKSGELYTEYRAYCARSGEYARNTTEFYSTLEQRGFARKKTSRGHYVLGLEVQANRA